MRGMLLLLLQLLAFLSSSEAQWKAKDLYTIDCGSSSPTSASSSSDDRQWQGEPPNLPAFTSAGIPSNTSAQNPNLPSPVPYLTARVFTSKSNYTFPVDPGRHWIRLHFYPFQTPPFDLSLAAFTLSVGPHRLFKSAGLTLSVYIIKEYTVDIPVGSPLVIVLDPLNNSTFAFINGIEIISMPDDALKDDAVLLGQGVSTKFGFSSLALETMYRLNVGGASVNLMNDTQRRAWSPDQKFIEGAASGVATQDYRSSIRFTKEVPEYIAPAAVYGTARVLGISRTVGNNFRISWRLPVGAGYHYLVRLHFAELNFDKTYQRVFDVFINNKTAIDGMDLIALGPEYNPVYRDFVVLSTGLSSLRVQIGPSSSAVSQYSDAILNGLEVFKMNDTSGSLSDDEVSTAGGASSSRSTTSKALGAIVGATVGGIAAAAVAAACCFFICRRNGKRRGKSPVWRPASTSLVSIGYPPSATTGSASHYTSSPANLSRHFSLQQIMEATNNFDDDLLLGVGGFGKVYKGELDGGVEVAVKRGSPMSEQGLTEFQTEIEMLSKLRHRHLVSLIGYCDENSEMILVYDYMANGPLRGHLYGGAAGGVPPLSWKQRLEICIGAARGLHYLHTGAQRAIIHRDVKTTNILLDGNFVAKVSDFGLSKVGPSLDHTHVSTAVKGSFGYLDPEYFRRQQLTEKSDVYSFGVVLMEVFCARPAINPALPRDQVNIAEWALHWQTRGRLESIMDPKLAGDCTLESLLKFGEVAERCLADRGTERPSIGDVLWNLEYALQLHEARLVSGRSPLQATEQNSPTTGNSQQFSEHDSSEDASASIVFSQLVHQQGR